MATAFLAGQATVVGPSPNLSERLIWYQAGNPLIEIENFLRFRSNKWEITFFFKKIEDPWSQMILRYPMVLDS